MTEYGDLLTAAERRRSTVSRFRPAVLVLVPIAAVLFQVYVPLFFRYLGYLELPLLVVLYYAMMRRRPIAGLTYGAAIGLLQDSFSDQPIGMFGIVKTLVGYFGASAGIRFEVERDPPRLVLAFFFFFFHQFSYWVLARALLGHPLSFSVEQTILLGILNAIVAVPLFRLLDKLRERA